MKHETTNGAVGKHKPYGPYEKFFKRPLDIICGVAALLVFWWLYIIVAVLVRIKLGSPVIFKQERPGRDEKIFCLYKFRTMTDERDENGELLPDGIRLTKFGKRLRATSLDELPQLWNVFIGDMAFIGPRPERKFYIDQIIEHDSRYTYLYQIRPGVTSYATLYNGYTDTMEKMLRRLELDLYYLEHRSWWFDSKILVKTFINIVSGKKF